MNTTIYTAEGKSLREFALPEALFGVAWNPTLVHDVVVAMQGNERRGTAHTKGRGEIRGGGKKPWKQKGTSRARHGSTRSPIWVGGGVAHGPRTEKDYTVKLNRKVKAKALATVLSKKQVDNEVVFVDAMVFAEPKTASAKSMMSAIASGSQHETLVTKRKNAAVIVLPKRDVMLEKSFQNFGHMTVMQAKDINPVDLLTYKYVVMVSPEATLEILEKRVAPITTTK